MIFSPIALCPKKTSQFSPFFGNSFAEFEPRFLKMRPSPRKAGVKLVVPMHGWLWWNLLFRQTPGRRPALQRKSEAGFSSSPARDFLRRS
jgi:hypothetical protein